MRFHPCWTFKAVQHYICYGSDFRNVPQAVISMKQGNWDRKKVSIPFPVWRTAAIRALVVAQLTARSLITNQIWHQCVRMCVSVSFLDCSVGGGVHCFVSDFPVHGFRAFWEGARNSWAGKDWEGSCIPNAVIWNEGRSPDLCAYVCRLFSSFHINGGSLASSDYWIRPDHSSPGVGQLGGGADASGGALASVWLYHRSHSTDALYFRSASQTQLIIQSLLHRHQSSVHPSACTHQQLMRHQPFWKTPLGALVCVAVFAEMFLLVDFPFFSKVCSMTSLSPNARKAWKWSIVHEEASSMRPLCSER